MNPTSANLPAGATATAGYNYANLSSSTSVSYKDGTDWQGQPITKTITTSAVYDGWGRVVQSVDQNNGQINTAYDVMGRIVSRTNPFSAGGTPGPATSVQYDLSNKAVVTTIPGGNTIRSDYSGSAVTATDQVSRKTKREMDGLGRLIKVTEQTSTGALTQETNYTFDLLNNLTQVNQGGQYRSYKYDAKGRLLFERIPEQTATIADGGVPNQWTAAYAYTEFSAVKKKTDARGVETHYFFDALHRVTQSWYTGVGGDDSGSVRPALPSGVAAIGDTFVGYTESGAVSNVTINNTSGVGSAYTETYTFDDNNRPQSVTRYLLDPSSDSRKTYTTNYEYNQGNQLSKIIYPSGQQVSTNHDDRGRLLSLTNNPGDTSGYLTGVSYNVEGRMTGGTLGNGVVQTYGFDNNRSQLISQTATKGATQLMNLSYGYNASAGQSGTTTTAGNTHQLISLSGTINGTTESASYTYDLQKRLVTSNQTSNGSSVQRKFAYDRWGNRTTVWPSTLGGTAIQTVTLAQSGGAPTNQIASVTNSGVTVNYSYDAAGNVTNDGAHSYTYDAANRLVSLDGGAVQYKYDHQNQRVSKIVGSSWTHYIWEGGQVISEHDATTAYSTNPPYQQKSARLDYIYARGKMIQTRQRATSTDPWTARYYISDVWSTRLVLDTSGNVLGRQGHLPFGEEFAGSGTQEKHHFTSYEAESQSGTDYAVNRQYLQSVGRFGSADPFQASSYLVNPQSWNRYSYVENDPIHNVDRLGLFEAYPEPGVDPCCTYTACGVGGGQGAPPSQKPKLKYIGTFGYVRQFFADNSDCVTAFQRLGIYDGFLRTAQFARYVDFTDPVNLQWAGLRFRELGLRSNVNRNLTPFPKLWSPTIAISWWTEQVVTIGDSFYSLQGYLQQQSTVIHEDLHLYFRAGHVDIARILGIGRFADEDTASQHIDTWLENRCH